MKLPLSIFNYYKYFDSNEVNVIVVRYIKNGLNGDKCSAIVTTLL